VIERPRAKLKERDFVRITDPNELYPQAPLEIEAQKSILAIRRIWATLVLAGGLYLAKKIHKRILKNGSIL
jgi:hypothetical protein